MRIYIASSWKNQHAVEMLTDFLEGLGRSHQVISFVRQAEEDEGRVHFGDVSIDEWIESEAGERKFDFDLQGAMESDLVIYVGPSGTDAWAEVGAAYGSGVPIFGLWAKGEQAGLMRHMVAWFKDYQRLLNAVDEKAEVDKGSEP